MSGPAESQLGHAGTRGLPEHHMTAVPVQTLESAALSISDTLICHQKRSQRSLLKYIADRSWEK